MKIKRIIACLIDIVIVSIISGFLVIIPIFKYNATEHNKMYEEYFNQIISSGSAEVDEDSIKEFAFNFNREGVPLEIVTTAVMVLYFGIAGYLSNGTTIGKKLMKIKIVPAKGKNLNPSLFILREIILFGILFRLITIGLTISINSYNEWYDIYNTVSNISTITTFIIYGFIIFRDDERGLHDLIANTKVISTKESVTAE